MGGLGLGGHGGTVTVEGTASYVLTASMLICARLQMGQLAGGRVYFGEERFAVDIKVDTSDRSDPFIDLTDQTRDDREVNRARATVFD